LAIVQTAASQAASTVKQLRAFGPQAQQEPRAVDPVRVVHSIERMLRTLSPKNVELVVAAQPTAAICIDEGLLQSALMNLSLNAWDAMREGGRLEIHIRQEPAGAAADGGEAGLADPSALGSVIIEVRDTGIGMDDATRARAFAPFYTTKGARGTGLGLSSVRDTVEAARGTVAVESGLGSGTCVRLRLPAVAHSVSAPPPAPARVAALEGKVLVLDDDQAVRRTVATYLRRCGLTTFEAQTRDEALQLTTGSNVDVVVTDGVVSGTTVASFLHDLRRSAPGVRVVLCSGSAPEAFEAAREFADATLAKPFELESLITSLRPLMARAQPLQAPPV
jgi:CheY-like chemotaxis protein